MVYIVYNHARVRIGKVGLGIYNKPREALRIAKHLFPAARYVVAR